jgi:hypothetical protein
MTFQVSDNLKTNGFRQTALRHASAPMTVSLSSTRHSKSTPARRPSYADRVGGSAGRV